MTEQNQEHRDGAVPDASGERPAFDASRRRFTGAGLVTPVVLGSLASKPVLAFDAACTVSGQISGNASGPGVVTCAVGNSLSHWVSPSNSWPTQITKGDLPNTGCQGTNSGTVFNGFQGLQNAFYYYHQTSPGSCQFTLDSSGSSGPATMYSVLNSDLTDPLVVLGKATVVSLLNAYSLTTSYPVTVATIVEMFNATWNGGLYQINSSVSWNQTQVISYLQSLYP